MGVVGGIKQWEENVAGKSILPSVLALSGTWPWASPLLGFSVPAAPAVWSCLCPAWTRGWVQRGAGGPTRCNCSCSPCSGGRTCLGGRCRHPVFRRRLVGPESCSAAATSALRSRPAAADRSKAVFILWAKRELVARALSFYDSYYLYSLSGG